MLKCLRNVAKSYIYIYIYIYILVSPFATVLATSPYTNVPDIIADYKLHIDDTTYTTNLLKSLGYVKVNILDFTKSSGLSSILAGNLPVFSVNLTTGAITGCSGATTDSNNGKALCDLLFSEGYKAKYGNIITSGVISTSEKAIIYNPTETLNIDKVIFSGNTYNIYRGGIQNKYLYGGGIIGANGGILSIANISNSIFSGNFVYPFKTVMWGFYFRLYGGGIIGVRDGNLSIGNISNSIFSNNDIVTTYIYGAGLIGGYNSSVFFNFIENSLFINNGYGYGGYNGDQYNTPIPSILIDLSVLTNEAYNTAFGSQTPSFFTTKNPEKTFTLSANNGITIFQNNATYRYPNNTTAMGYNSFKFTGNGGFFQISAYGIDDIVALYDPIWTTGTNFTMNIGGEVWW